MFQTFRFLVLLSIFPLTAFAQDSSKVYPVAEVIVTATRSPIRADDSPVATSSVPVNAAQLSVGSTIADLLTPISGVFVRDNGPSGQIKLASIRGLSSENVLILQDGIRVTSMQNGLADLGLLPIHNLERVEIVRGGSSAFYGGDASAGVINLLTKEAPPGTRGSITVGTGSYGFRTISGSGSYGTDFANASVGLRWEEGKDDYEFVFPRAHDADTSMRYSNADHTRLSATAAGKLILDDHSYVRIAASGMRARRGIPGPITPGVPLSSARQTDDLAHLSLNVNRSEGSFNTSIAVGYQYGDQKYADPAWPSDSRTRTISVQPRVEFVASPALRLSAGGEWTEGKLQGSDFDGRLLRIQRAMYVSGEWTMQRDEELLDRALVFIAGRYDNTNSFGESFTPKIGANVRIWQPLGLRIRASYGKNFRVPTFNDVAFRFFSNPALKPEYSTTADGGILMHVGTDVEQDAEITYFSIVSRDRILFHPVRWIPVNIGRVESEGWEIRSKTSIPDIGAALTADATLIRASGNDELGITKPSEQLPYIPHNSWSLGLHYELAGTRLAVIQTWTSRRSTGVGIRPFLASYARTDIQLGHELMLGLMFMRLTVEARNVFDTDYEVYMAYPMPGRILRIGMDLEL